METEPQPGASPGARRQLRGDRGLAPPPAFAAPPKMAPRPPRPPGAAAAIPGTGPGARRDGGGRAPAHSVGMGREGKGLPGYGARGGKRRAPRGDRRGSGSGEKNEEMSTGGGV